MARWDSQIFDANPVEEELAAAEAGRQRNKFSRVSDSAVTSGPRPLPQTFTPERRGNAGVKRVLPPSPPCCGSSPPLNPSAFQNAFNCLASSVRATSTTPKPNLLPSQGRSLLPTRSSLHLRGHLPQQLQQQYSSSPPASSYSGFHPAAGNSTCAQAVRHRRSFPGQGDLIHDGGLPQTAASSRQGSPSFSPSLAPPASSPPAQQRLGTALQGKPAANSAATFTPLVHTSQQLKRAPSSRALQALAGSTAGSGVPLRRPTNSDWWLDVTASAVQEQKRRASWAGVNICTPPKPRQQAR